MRMMLLNAPVPQTLIDAYARGIELPAWWKGKRVDLCRMYTIRINRKH